MIVRGGSFEQDLKISRQRVAETRGRITEGTIRELKLGGERW